MNLVGSISTRKRVRADNQECYGTCNAYKRTFTIRIAESAFDDPIMFADTLLHELIHLWLFIVMTRCNTQMSDRGHHTIIDMLVPKAVLKLKKFLIDRKRKISTRRK